MTSLNDKLACDTVEMLEKMIGELNKKPNITSAELDALKDAYNLRMALHDRYGDDGMSYARGRSPVTGRYISRDPMMHDDMMMDHRSMHSIKDRMIARLEAMYDEAKSEHEREEIRKEIRRIESER